MNNVQPSFAGHFSVLSLPAVLAPSVLSPMALIPTSTDIALRPMEPSGSTVATTFAPNQLKVMNGAAAPLTMGALLKVCRRLDWPGEVGVFSYEKAMRLVQHIGADTLVGSITTDYVDQLVDELRHGGLKNQRRPIRCGPQSNSTIGKYLSALKVMLKRAQRRRVIRELPIFPEPRSLRASERNVFTPRWEWMDAQVTYLSDRPDVADLIRFLADTGCRLSEAFELTWDRIDLTAKVPHVTFTNCKGHRPRKVPIGRDDFSMFHGRSAIKALEQRLKVRNANSFNTQGPFFHVGRSEGAARAKAFRYQFNCGKHAVCDEYGLDAVTRKQWRPHSIRKARITYLLCNNVSTWAVKNLVGHRSASTTYAHYADVAALEETMMTEELCE